MNIGISKQLLGAACVLWLSATSAHAAVIGTLFGTGQGAVAPGPDAHYSVTAQPVGGGLPAVPRAADILNPVNNPPSYINGNTFNWVGPTANSNSVPVPAGTYTYETTFDLTGFDPTTATFSGQFAADNGATLFLNGVNTGFISPGQTALTSYTLSTGFLAGVNTLSFVLVNNDDAPGSGSLSGLQNIITSSSVDALPVVPEVNSKSSGIPMLVLTGILCALSSRRRYIAPVA